MVVLEAVSAKFGDALLLHYTHKGAKKLWVIDGGPPGVWKKSLRPSLENLKGNAVTLTVDVAMLSHVDDDHVAGILQMTGGIAERKKGAATWLDIRRFWHNSFPDLVGSDAKVKAAQATLAGLSSAAGASLASSSPAQIAGVVLDTPRERAVLASIGQGRGLRGHLEQLKLSGNGPFGGLVESGKKKTIDGAKITVVGPIASRVAAFRKKWDEAVQAASPAAIASLFREKLDESPTNLSSIVMLVEVGGKKILLTGDARGDDIVAGFKEARTKLPLKLDILKMPHHGSDRNMTEDFLKKFPADHYVISADGHHGNPDDATLKAIVETRGDKAEYTIHLTNRVRKQPDLLKKLKKGRKFDYRFREAADFSISVELP